MKITNPLTLMIMTMILVTIGQCLYFSNGTDVIPYSKTKLGISGFYEDRAFSSNNLLMVADGIGGSGFPAGIIANSVLYGVAAAFYQNEEEEKIPFDSERIKTAITSGIEFYNQIFYSEVFKDEIESSQLKIDQTVSSTTIVGVSLETETNGKAFYKFFQLGDSLGLLLRKIRVDDASSYYYPVMKSSEGQREFNCPHQVGNTDYNDALRDLYTHKFEAVKNDIFVLGSDGLFDNLTEQVIAIIINFRLLILSKIRERGEDPKYEYMSKMANDFVLFINKRKAANKYFKSKDPAVKEFEERKRKNDLELFQLNKKRQERAKRRSTTEVATTSSSFSLFEFCGCLSTKKSQVAEPTSKKNIYESQHEASPSRITLTQNLPLPRQLNEFYFTDMSKHQINQEAVDDYVNQFLDKIYSKDKNEESNQVEKNIFEIFGCNIKDYYESKDNNELSDCIAMALKSLKVPVNVSSYYCPNYVINGITEFLQQILSQPANLSILVPFSLNALKAKRNYGRFIKAKPDDIGISMGLVKMNEPSTPFDKNKSFKNFQTKIYGELNTIKAGLKQIRDLRAQKMKIEARRKEINDLKNMNSSNNSFSFTNSLVNKVKTIQDTQAKIHTTLHKLNNTRPNKTLI